MRTHQLSYDNQPQAPRHVQIIAPDGGTRRGYCCKRRGSAAPGAMVDYKCNSAHLSAQLALLLFFFFLFHLTSVIAVQRTKLMIED